MTVQMSQARRPGFTLVEVLIAVVLTAVVGAAVTSVFVNQSAFYDTQTQMTEARSVSRAAVNMLTRELRSVDTTIGIEGASPDTIRVKMPFAMGLACGVAASGRLHVSLFPVDSVVLANARLAITNTSGNGGGYAWRDPATGAYDAESIGGAGVAVVAASTRCITAQVATTFSDMSTRARIVEVQAPSGSVPDAVPVMLYLKVAYFFAPSDLVPGSRGLYRQVAGMPREELAAPFDASARFRFYPVGSATAQDAPPSPISNLRGIELAFVGRSDRPDADGTHRETPLTTAIFFRNRID